MTGSDDSDNNEVVCDIDKCDIIMEVQEELKEPQEIVFQEVTLDFNSQELDMDVDTANNEVFIKHKIH